MDHTWSRLAAGFTEWFKWLVGAIHCNHRSLKTLSSLWHVRYLRNDYNIPADIKIASGYKTGDEINSVHPLARAVIKLSGALWVCVHVSGRHQLGIRVSRFFQVLFHLLIEFVVVE
jgi:hypothetical protein